MLHRSLLSMNSLNKTHTAAITLLLHLLLPGDHITRMYLNTRKHINTESRETDRQRDRQTDIHRKTEGIFKDYNTVKRLILAVPKFGVNSRVLKWRCHNLAHSRSNAKIKHYWQGHELAVSRTIDNTICLMKEL